MACFRSAPVKPNERTALPMLRHHRDGAIGALLPPKSTAASQTSWDKASDFSINPSAVKKGRKNHHKGPPIPFDAAPGGAHPSLAHIPQDPGHLLCLSFPPSNTGAMKYTHFCMPQGNQRDCFHFSHFLLAGLGNNEKNPAELCRH